MSPRGLIVATQFLTRLPTPRLEKFEAADLGRASLYFPLVGAIVGCFVAGAYWAGSHISPWVGALAGLIAWVLVTGAIHLDGLGDVADALGAAHKSPDRFHEVLADPHAGSFAVIAIALQIATKLVLLAALPAATVLTLVLVPAWARWGALVWSAALPTLKPGLGRNFSSQGSGAMVGAWCAVLLAGSLWIAPALATAVVIVGGIALFWRRRLGGITGDCLGAGIEVTESLLLLALAVVAHVGWPLT